LLFWQKNWNAGIYFLKIKMENGDFCFFKNLKDFVPLTGFQPAYGFVCTKLDKNHRLAGSQSMVGLPQ
jgi:hypothetical protein